MNMDGETSERMATNEDYEQIDKLRKKNMDYMSTDISKLAEALSKAQGIMRGAREDANNPFFKSKYADLTSVWEACRDCLSANGLSVTQMIDNEAERLRLVTILMHSSGQWVRSFMPIIPKNMNAQEIGSAMTYARRYALAAIVGVCPADDDGERAMGRQENFNNYATVHSPQPKQVQKPAYLVLSEDQVCEISDLLGNDEKLRADMLRAVKADSVGAIPAEKAEMVIAKLKAKKKEEVLA